MGGVEESDSSTREVGVSPGHKIGAVAVTGGYAATPRCLGAPQHLFSSSIPTWGGRGREASHSSWSSTSHTNRYS